MSNKFSIIINIYTQKYIDDILLFTNVRLLHEGIDSKMELYLISVISKGGGVMGAVYKLN